MSVNRNRHTGETHAYCDDCGWHSFGVNANEGGRRTASRWDRAHRKVCPVGPPCFLHKRRKCRPCAEAGV